MKKRIVPDWVYWGSVASAVFVFFYCLYISLLAWEQRNMEALGIGIGWMIGGVLFLVKTQSANMIVKIEPPQIRAYEPSGAAMDAIKLPRGEYVYILQDVSNTGYCKIGYTNAPHKRLNNFFVKLPIDLSLVHIIKTKNRRQLENQLHTMFGDKRVRGEWFELDYKDIEYLKSLPF